MTNPRVKEDTNGESIDGHSNEGNNVRTKATEEPEPVIEIGDHQDILMTMSLA